MLLSLCAFARRRVYDAARVCECPRPKFRNTRFIPRVWCKVLSLQGNQLCEQYARNRSSMMNAANWLSLISSRRYRLARAAVSYGALCLRATHVCVGQERVDQSSVTVRTRFLMTSRARPAIPRDVNALGGPVWRRSPISRRNDRCAKLLTGCRNTSRRPLQLL